METQKIVNLLNNTENEYSKFATKKWYIIDSESKGNYSRENPIKFITSSLESSLWDYSDAYILVTGNIAVTRTIAPAGDNPLQRKWSLAAATQVAFKIVHHLKTVEQKLMVLLLIMHILLILQCLFTA